MKRGQSRRASLLEAVINILIGYGINMLANFTLFPLFGWHITLEQNLLLGVLYTVISLCRSYFLRRFFNRFTNS